MSDTMADYLSGEWNKAARANAPYAVPYLLSFGPIDRPGAPVVPGRGAAGWTMARFGTAAEALAFMDAHRESAMPCWPRHAREGGVVVYLGQRVRIRKPGSALDGQLGTVKYVRMGAPSYSQVEAVSVLLDCIARPEYSGTIFPAAEVEEIILK